MKKFLSLMLLLCLMVSVVPASAEEVLPRVMAMKGPTAMGMVKMMDTEAEKYSFEIAAAIDMVTPKLVKGEVDIAAVPANVASVLYNNTKGKVQVLAVNTLGVLYIVENGDTVKAVEDLKGKTIYASGKGATPEYALNYLLEGNNLTDSVTVEYKAEHAECLSALVANEGSVAMLPQPFVTTAQMKNDKIRIALDMNTEWANLQTGEEKSALLTGVLVGRTEYVQNNPGQVAAFLDAYQQSVAFANENVAETAKLIGSEKFNIVPEKVALKALPYCQIVCIEGADMKEKLSGYLKVLFDQNPSAVGGALPDEAFYYQR